MNELANLNSVSVVQQRNVTEIITGIEAKNRYDVFSPEGVLLMTAPEEGRNFLKRFFLGAGRPFGITVLDPEGRKLMSVQSPFRFFFRECTVTDHNGAVLAVVKRGLSLLRKHFTAYDASGVVLFDMRTSIGSPWSFRVIKSGLHAGNITKKWAGFLKEAFSDADNYLLEFSNQLSPRDRAVMLGSVFLIDFTYFENRD